MKQHINIYLIIVWVYEENSCCDYQVNKKKTI